MDVAAEGCITEHYQSFNSQISVADAAPNCLTPRVAGGPSTRVDEGLEDVLELHQSRSLHTQGGRVEGECERDNRCAHWQIGEEARGRVLGMGARLRKAKMRDAFPLNGRCKGSIEA